MSKTYLAITIGPIYKTIERARKTRELWAASFLLSEFMRTLLEGLVEGAYGEALSPDISTLNPRQKLHGAGIWNDNCFFKIHDNQVENLKIGLPGIIVKAKKEIIGLALFELDRDEKGLGFSTDKLQQILAQHFHCHAVLAERREDTTEPILEHLRALTASAEMRDLYPPQYDDFVSRAMFRGVAVKGLYHLGFEENDPIFTYYKNKFDQHEKLRRMPSLLEIGLREFKREDKLYQIVEGTVSKYSQENDDLETDEENQEIIRRLKDPKENPGLIEFKKRHKYVAIVQSDGDGVGKLISGQTDEAQIKEISTALMAFSTAAVKKIENFDGLPVYAGGDDLLFFAPLQNKDGQNIFKLIEDLHAVFKAQGLLSNTSISFGVSIFYYKYPLSEALENGRELLNKLAKKLAFQYKEDDTSRTKNALAFRVMLHAGQSFAAVLRQDGVAWQHWKNLLSLHAKQDAAFVSGIVHTLEQLGWLLEQACESGTTEAFFDHHFNEAKDSVRWPFVKAVRLLAEAIHAEYSTLQVESVSEKRFFDAQLHFPDVFWESAENTPEKRLMEFRNNLLYSALRMIQFLNADDHE